MFDRALLALPHAARALALLMVCALVQAGTIIGQSLALAAALSGIWAGAPLADQAAAITVFICCYAGRHVLVFVRDTLLDRFARARAAELRDRMLRTIFCGSVGLAAREGSPVLADAAIQGIDQVESYIRVIMPKMAGLVAVMVPVLVCVFVIDWVSGIILLVLLPVTMLFMVLIGRSARARAEKQYASYQVLSNHFVDTLRGIRTLRVFGVAERYADVVYNVSERFRKATMRTLGVATLSSSVLDLIATAGVAAVSIMLGFRLLDGSLVLFTGLAVLVLAPEFFRPLREFASDFHASLDGKNALAAIGRIIGGEEGQSVRGAQPARVVRSDACNNSPKMESHEKNPRSVFSESILGLKNANGMAPQEESLPLWSPESRLTLQNVAFAYEGAEAPTLHDVTLQLEGFERVAIVGPSGAGKSTLVDLLGGFKTPTAGAMEWDGRLLTSLDDSAWRSQVIYIPQHPHIFHATLRDNIAFYSPAAPLDRIWQAVAAMGLDALVADLPEGLDTVIGEGGHGLSGGQAQRIALARAFLDPGRRILLFDEPTAHLDIETELELKQRMLPLMEGRLVVFATHRLHWLDSMDRVVRIQDGMPFMEEGSALVGETDGEAAGETAEETAGGAVRKTAGETAEEAAGNGNGPPPIPAAGGVTHPRFLPRAAEDGANRGRVTSQETASSSTVRPRRVRWVGSYVRGKRKLLAGACALGVVAFVCAAMLMFSAGYLIGYTAQPDALLIAIMMPMAFVQLFGVGRPVARYLQRLTSHDWVFRVTSDLRRRLYLAVERRSADPRAARSAGDYLGLLSDDIGHLQNLFLRVAMPAIIAAVLVVLVAIACAIFDLAFAGVVLVLMVIAALAVPLAALRASRKRAAQVKRMTAQLYDALTDNVIGSADWLFAGRGAEFCRANAHEEARLRTLQAGVRTAQRVAHLAISLLFGALACIAMAWAAGHFGGGPGTGGNLVIAFTLVVFPLVEAFLGLPDAALSADSHLDSLDRLQEAGAADVVVAGEDATESEGVAAGTGEGAVETVAADEGVARAEGAAGTEVAAAGAGEGATEAADAADGPANSAVALAFDNAAFSYERAGAPVLENLTFSVPAGQKVAILGRSGAGKSTLLGLARGDLQPTAGAVLVEGAPPAQLGDVSRHIGVVAQDAYLFNQTLRQNVVLARPGITDDDVRGALARVGLGPLLDSLPRGLDTPMHEAGARFSGGERQRIALARVLLSPSPLVLFDEPAVGLDPATENALFDSIFDALAGRTLVVVTHHLQEVDRFDRVVFIENGRIALDGAPADLARESARYRQLLALD